MSPRDKGAVVVLQAHITRSLRRFIGGREAPCGYMVVAWRHSPYSPGILRLLWSGPILTVLDW